MLYDFKFKRKEYMYHSIHLTNYKKHTREDAVKALLLGLITDGSHHKQYYLELALRALCEKEHVEEVKKEFDWEEGIPS